MRPAGEPKARRLGISSGRRSFGCSGRAGRGGGTELPTSRRPARQTSARRRVANAFATGSAIPRTATAPPVRLTGGESVILPLTFRVLRLGCGGGGVRKVPGDQLPQMSEAGGAAGAEIARLPPLANRIEQAADRRTRRNPE